MFCIQFNVVHNSLYMKKWWWDWWKLRWMRLTLVGIIGCSLADGYDGWMLLARYTDGHWSPYLASYHSFDNYVLFYSFYSSLIFTHFYLTFGGFRHCQFISVSVAGIQPVIYSPTNVSARHIAQIHLFLFIPHYWWLSLVNAKWFILKEMYLPGTLPKSIYSYSYLITGGYLW